MTHAKDPTRPLVRVNRVLPASPERVFAAWTDAKSLMEWFCPGTISVAVAELDVRVGGRFRIVMRGEEREDEIRGVYREVVPPVRLVFTWVSSVTRGEESLVTVELRAAGGATELVLTHERLPDEDSRGKHRGGWESIVGKLAHMLARAPVSV